MLKSLTKDALVSLREAVPQNLERYRAGSFDFLDTDPTISRNIPTPDMTLSFVNFGSSPSDDVQDCTSLYTLLGELSPTVACDERFWTFIAHTAGLTYARSRWPIPVSDEAAMKHVLTHFFAKGRRGLERDNAIARLWWTAHVCSGARSLELARALKVLLHRTDVRANLLERPNSALYSNVLDFVLSSLSESLDGDGALFERTRFRDFMRRLNRFGGRVPLETQSKTALSSLFE